MSQPTASRRIETTGRRSGLASSSSDYVANLLAYPVVRLKLGRRWWVGTATPRHDDDPLTIRIDLKGLASAS